MSGIRSCSAAAPGGPRFHHPSVLLVPFSFIYLFHRHTRRLWVEIPPPVSLRLVLRLLLLFTPLLLLPYFPPPSAVRKTQSQTSEAAGGNATSPHLPPEGLATAPAPDCDVMSYSYGGKTDDKQTKHGPKKKIRIRDRSAPARRSVDGNRFIGSLLR